MTRNLKALGLALVAMLALGAVAAAGASAQQGVLTSDNPVTLDISQNEGEGAGPNALTAFGGKVEAPGTTYTGHKLNEPTKFLESGEETATITPHYKQEACVHTFIGVKRPCTITTNGCDFVFHIGETTEEKSGTYGVTADVDCPGTGGFIDLHVYKGGTIPGEHNDIPNKLFCTITVPEQANLPGPHLTNDVVNGDINIKGTFTGITVTKHGGAGCGGEETIHNGQFHIDATIKGTNEAGGNTNVVITDE
jgi:hypothetical protein